MFKKSFLSLLYSAIITSFCSAVFAGGMGMTSDMVGTAVSGGARMMMNQSYQGFSVDLSGDVFTDPSAFMNVTNGMEFQDDNHDGVVDLVQNTDWFKSMGLAWEDSNQDGIGDMFQTIEMYQMMGMNNFVDIDGDGLSDNYKSMPMVIGKSGMIDFYGSGMMQTYGAFDVDLNNDVFTNPLIFKQISGGMNFVDDNNDGVVDIVQNTPWFTSMGFGKWEDSNQDGISDMFQTMEMYQALGMDNYIDINGDGLCDNYAKFQWGW